MRLEHMLAAMLARYGHQETLKDLALAMQKGLVESYEGQQAPEDVILAMAEAARQTMHAANVAGKH